MLTFLTFNDVYEINARAGWCGLAGMATLIRQEKAKAEHPIVSLCGDFLGGSMLAVAHRGLNMVDIVNNMGVDICCVGNHELDHGMDAFDDCVARSRFSWLGTNVLDNRTGRVWRGLQSTLVRDYGPVRVGMLGITTDETCALSRPGPYMTFADPCAAATAAVQELSASGCQLIVAYTHQSLDDDLKLARAVPQIQLILGGHEHQTVAIQENQTLIVKAGTNAQYLGRIDAHVESGGAVFLSWAMLPNRGCAPDADVAAVIARYEDAFRTRTARPVVRLEVPLDTRFFVVRSQENAACNLTADLVRALFDADVVLLNGGMFRGDRVYATGTVLTEKDVMDEFPFADQLGLYAVTGRQLLGVLEQCLQKRTPTGTFPHLSGARVTFDSRRLPLKRVVGCTVHGVMLDPARTYRVVLPKYIQAGGDGITAAREAPALEHPAAANDTASLVMQALRTQGVHKAVVEQRVHDLAQDTG